MNKFAPFFALTVFLTAVSTGHAQIITQTDTLSNVSVGSSAFSVPLSFTPFDPTLGTLNEVDYSFNATLSISGYVTRTGTYNITFNLPYRLEGTSQLDAQTISTTISGSASAGTSTPVSYSFTAGSDNISTAMTPSSLDFESGLSDTHTGNNTYSIGSASLTGTFTLTYDYTPVPEPSTWALVLGGLIFLVWRLRARRG